MAASVLKCAPKGLNSTLTEGKGVSVGDFFHAACELNIDWIEVKVKRGELDVNSVYCYGQTSQSGRPDYHMLQSFESAKNGKVTTQVFEKIDHVDESEVNIILHMLQLLVSEGLSLKEVISDGRTNKFSFEDSDYFWFTVLRKLYIYSCDPAKEESHKTAFKSLASFLEENLFNGCQIVHTTRLFLAVENGDYETVEEMLERFSEQRPFHSYMRAIPGKIFPNGTYKDDHINANPVAFALRRRDVRMLQLLCRYPCFKQPPLGMTRKWKMDVSLCLDILRGDELFFDNLDLSIFQWNFPTESSVNVAKLFRACEENNLKELLSNPTLFTLQMVKNTYVSSRSPIVCEKDLDRLWITKLYIEKSVILIAVENTNMEMFEYFEDMGLDITDLGMETQYDSSSKARNTMFLWYLMIKYHLTNLNYRFVYNISQKPNIWEGPALVGCLFTAARRKDIATMEQIANYFDSSWFNGPKYMGLTAHGLLVKHGFEKEASHLLTCVGPQFTTESNQADIESKLNEAESIKDFKQLIESNLHWLNKGFLGHRSLMMIFVTSTNFSLEKFEFLVREREADIRMVSSEKQTMLDCMLEWSYLKESSAERLLGVLQYEEIQDVLLITANFLSDLSKSIFKASNSGRVILLKCFKFVINLPTQTLETIFFPKHAGRFDKEVTGIFEVIHSDSDLFEISADRAFQLIGKEEKQITSLVHLLRVYVKSILPLGYNPNKLNNEMEKKLLNLFQFFLVRLKQEERRKETGYQYSLEDWRDTYGMTFLMRLMTDNADIQNNWAFGVDLLIQKIIEVFDDEYINTKVDLDLGPQFNLQHRLGVTSENKKKNTVISKDQLIKVKRVEKLNLSTGQYEPMENDGQVKVISKEKIKVSDDGPERMTRVMVTVEKPDATVQETIIEDPESKEMDEEHFTDDEEPFDLEAVSLDGDGSEEDGGENNPVLDLEEDELETRIERWNLGQDGIKERSLKPEHFDKTSVLTKTNQTFMTKENKYKYAQSASTRFIETHSEVEADNKHFVKKTTLLLLSCRTNK